VTGAARHAIQEAGYHEASAAFRGSPPRAQAPAGLLELWEGGGAPPVWAAAWLELRPARLCSYRGA